MKNYRCQHGMTTTGWLCVLVIGIICAQLCTKLFPVYMDDYLVRASFQGLANENNLSAMSLSEMRESLKKKMAINDVDQQDKEITFRHADDAVIVSSRYEKRVKLVANIDLVISFEHKLNSSDPQECCSP